jgi:methyltransferase-like protein 23
VSAPPKGGGAPAPLADLPLHEFRLRLDGREWSVQHTGEVLTYAEEARFLSAPKDERTPYGVILWPAAIALAHDLAARADALPGRTLLELGAGTGLPGIVAASLGARVTQTDRLELALDVCRRNGARNGALHIRYRLADWTAWDDPARYDFIVGSDVLYAERLHPHLRAIFETSLAPGGRVLLSDPFRAPSLALLEELEGAGWTIALSKWRIGEGDDARPIGVYELTRASGSEG